MPNPTAARADTRPAPDRAVGVPKLFTGLPMRLLLAAVLLSGCAAAQSHPLLEYDPVKMTDVGIVRYYYDLGEAIDACESSTQGDTTVSVGGGASTGGGSVFGVSVGQPVGRGCNSDSLRQRRVDTAIEMRRRNIQP